VKGDAVTRRRLGACGVGFLAAIIAVVAAMAPATEPDAVEAPRPSAASPTDSLPNLVQVHEQVYSGGLPEGEAGFGALRDLGVKTVISVDGAKPDVALARKYGLRYVHLPHGYDGIPSERALDLAKAVRDLPGPVYVHCHHGKHRSPAAAAVGCVTAGLIEPKTARGLLERAGTSPHYRGLYEAAESARPAADAVLDARRSDFPETAELPPMAEAMVEIEHAHDRMNAVAASGWKSPPNHPDVEPAHEALLLRELFTELLRTDDVRGRPERFRELLRESEASGFALEAALRTGNDAQAARSLERITAACTACHEAYRDVPR